MKKIILTERELVSIIKKIINEESQADAETREIINIIGACGMMDADPEGNFNQTQNYQFAKKIQASVNIPGTDEAQIYDVFNTLETKGDYKDFCVVKKWYDQLEGKDAFLNLLTGEASGLEMLTGTELEDNERREIYKRIKTIYNTRRGKIIPGGETKTPAKPTTPTKPTTPVQKPVRSKPVSGGQTKVKPKNNSGGGYYPEF